MTKEDLMKFCAGSGSSRRSLQTPFSEGPYTYATDGIVLIRVPRLEDVPENPNAPKNVGTVLDSFPQPESWFEIPEFPAIASEDCEDCDDCDGDGMCEHCGVGKCPTCNGTGRSIDSMAYVMVGPARLRCIPLSLLKTLPGVLIGPTGELSPARVKFDGGDGVIMPRTA